jgi:hypothetical protein
MVLQERHIGKRNRINIFLHRFLAQQVNLVLTAVGKRIKAISLQEMSMLFALPLPGSFGPYKEPHAMFKQFIYEVPLSTMKHQNTTNEFFLSCSSAM